MEETGFSSNMAYTCRGFVNFPHNDRDRSVYAYGQFAPTDLNGNFKSFTEGYQLIGHHFIVIPYRFLVDFSNIDGLVEIIWRGPIDKHCTTTGKLGPGCDKYAFSTQINQRLADRVQKCGGLQYWTMDKWKMSGHKKSSKFKGVAGGTIFDDDGGTGLDVKTDDEMRTNGGGFVDCETGIAGGTGTGGMGIAVDFAEGDNVRCNANSTERPCPTLKVIPEQKDLDEVEKQDESGARFIDDDVDYDFLFNF